jgi:toxin ParE1/3/4
VTLPLRWTEHAVDDLSTIAEYVSLSSPIYAEQLVDRIVRQLEQVRAYPESGRVVPEVGAPDIRELQVSPYRVMYRVLTDWIEVVSVVHSRRNFRDLPEDG